MFLTAAPSLALALSLVDVAGAAEDGIPVVARLDCSFADWDAEIDVGLVAVGDATAVSADVGVAFHDPPMPREP